MKEIFFYTNHFTERVKYTAEFIIQRLLGLKVTYVSDKTQLTSDQPCINYSDKILSSKEIFIPAHPLLSQENITKQKINIKKGGTLPYFFEVPREGTDLPFDLFSMSFYLLSRYEEYLPFKKDQHGRFSATQSIAYQSDFLHLPLIDLWVQKLKKILENKFPKLEFQKDNYYFQPSYDIDHAWAFKYKGLFRTFGAHGKELINLRFGSSYERLLVQLNRKTDPYDVFAYLNSLHQEFSIHPIYFFLLGDYGTFDKNISFRKWALQNLINELQKSYRLGIHPSYQSNIEKQRVVKERQRLEKIVGESIFRSRQHFLKSEFPNTYRILIDAIIKEDYSIGYADEIGFRASTAHDFLWFDLIENQTTSLRLFPFQVMDVTLKQYKNWTPQEALEQVKSIVDVCREVDGCFCTLWHNSSFTSAEGWTGWDKMYESLIQYAMPR